MIEMTVKRKYNKLIPSQGCSIMATMKDVAKEAGVSIATVSYYVNKKRVSEKKAQKIAAAIKTLNYVVQNSGRDLRVRSNDDIGILFPDIAEPYLEKIISSIKGFLTYQDRNFSLELSNDDPESELKSIKGFIGRKFAGIILYSCQPDHQKVFDLLAASGIPLVLIDRKPKDFECNFVSCDNYTLFHNLTQHLISTGRKNVALVCGPQDFTECGRAYEGYASAFSDAQKELEPSNVIFTRSLRESGFLAGMKLLETMSAPPDAVITTSSKIAEGLHYAFKLNRLNVGQDLFIITTGDSQDDVFYIDQSIIKTSRSAFEIGERAIRLLLQNIKSPVVFETQQIVVRDWFDARQLFSQPDFQKAYKAPHRETIDVLILDDYNSVNALQKLLVDFYSKENIEVNIHKVLPEHSYEYITTHLNRPDCSIDAFLFDIPWLQYLAENDYLLCLDDYFARYNVDADEFVPGILEQFSNVNGHAYALPYIATTQLLFYRKDLFYDEHLSRMFEEKYRIPLQPPKSYLQYSAIAQFFTRAQTPSSPVEYGHAMAISYTEQLMCSFLPRLWSFKGDLFDKAGAPSLTSPASRKAVKNLMECVQYAHPDMMQDRPTDAIEKFTSGRVAMLSTFFNYVTNVSDRYKSSVFGKVGYSSIAGGAPVMAGWCFGVGKHSRKADEAFRFIKWACCADIAIPHTILGGQSPQLKTYRNYDMVSLYPWLPKGLSEFANARKRIVPTEHNRSICSEKLVEEAVARELYPLITQLVSGVIPDNAAIEGALFRAEDELKRLVAESTDSRKK